MSLVTMFFIGARKFPGITKVMEECAEVIQVCAKLQSTLGEIIHYDGTNLKERLEDEIGDALAAFDFVIHHGGFNLARIAARQREKRALFERWQMEQYGLGEPRDVSPVIIPAPDQLTSDTAIRWDMPVSDRASHDPRWNPPLAPGLSSPAIKPGERLVSVHWKMKCTHRDDVTGVDLVAPDGECQVCFETGLDLQ